MGAAAGGSKRLQSGHRALPRGRCPAAVPGASCPVPAGRVGEPRSRLPPGAHPRSHRPVRTRGIVSGVGTSGLPQGQCWVAAVGVPGPSGAHLLTGTGEPVPGQQQGAGAGRAAKVPAAGPAAGPAQRGRAGAQAGLTRRPVHREFEQWPARRGTAGGRAPPQERTAVTADTAWKELGGHGLEVHLALQPVGSAELAPVPGGGCSQTRKPRQETEARRRGEQKGSRPPR